MTKYVFNAPPLYLMPPAIVIWARVLLILIYTDDSYFLALPFMLSFLLFVSPQHDQQLT